MERPVRQLLKQLREDNPSLTWRRGTRHYVVYLHGRMVGCVPGRLEREGMAPRVIAQFRRAGVRM